MSSTMILSTIKNLVHKASSTCLRGVVQILDYTLVQILSVAKLADMIESREDFQAFQKSANPVHVSYYR